MADKEEIFEHAVQRISAGVSGPGRHSGKPGPVSEQERRTSERALDRFPVELETASGQRLVAHTVDLSQGGLKVECAAPEAGAAIRVGDTLKVALNSPFLAAKNVRVIRNFQVLACEALPPAALRIRLHSQFQPDGDTVSLSGLEPHEFVMPAELEDTFMQTQAQVNLQLPHAASRLLLFTATEWGAGSSTISWWFSVCLSRTPERRVLFVDGNVHARMRQSGTQPIAGFVDLLLGQATLESTVLQLGAGAPDLLNVGKVAYFSSGEVSQTDVQATFELLREHYDYIVIDAPPALESSLTMLWGQAADGCMLVLESGKSQRADAQAVVGRLRQSGARVLGAMLNKV